MTILREFDYWKLSEDQRDELKRWVADGLGLVPDKVAAKFELVRDREEVLVHLHEFLLDDQGRKYRVGDEVAKRLVAISAEAAPAWISDAP